MGAVFCCRWGGGSAPTSECVLFLYPFFVAMSQPGDEPHQFRDHDASGENSTNKDTSPSDQEGWDGRCVTCGVSQTPMWRLGPGGGKNMCNACGIRWKRAQETMPVRVEKTIKKRKKKKTELEALMSPDNNSLSPPNNEKRLRSKLSPLSSSPRSASPTSSLLHALSSSDGDEDNDDDGDMGSTSMDMDMDMDREEDEPSSLPTPSPAPVSVSFAPTSWRPHESPFQSAAPSMPTPIASRSVSVPTTRPPGFTSSGSPQMGGIGGREAPFPVLTSSPLVHASVSVKREGKEAPGTPHGIGIDLNLLREILTRL